MMFTYSYDPETDLWAIISPDGYVHSYETFKRTAVIKVRKLNENARPSSAPTNR